MTTIDAGKAQEPAWEHPPHAEHFRSHAEEFDACKIGMWLFLTTEVLLFSGLFCMYAIFRMMYPEAFAAGSHYLNSTLGMVNTIVLLLSSFTMASCIRCAQLNKQGWLKFNLLMTVAFGGIFLFVKIVFEYMPKWAEGKRPGYLFEYAFTETNHEQIWWSVYYCATGIHGFHVLVGMICILWLFWGAAVKKKYGPKHYTGVEIIGLYWHLVDLIWIFLFPLLYLIH